MDEEGKRLLAVDLHHRDALAVPALELGVPADVDLVEVERDVGADLFEHAACALAQVAPRGAVQADAPCGYG